MFPGSARVVGAAHEPPKPVPEKKANPPTESLSLTPGGSCPPAANNPFNAILINLTRLVDKVIFKEQERSNLAL
jgi:hypothetical protein